MVPVSHPPAAQASHRLAQPMAWVIPKSCHAPAWGRQVLTSWDSPKFVPNISAGGEAVDSLGVSFQVICRL